MKNHFKSEKGNVIIEFTVTAIALFVPIVYVAIAAIQIATGYIEVQNVARVSARIFATSSDDSVGKTKVQYATNASLGTGENIKVSFDCSANPCLQPGELVKVSVTKRINLQLPGFNYSPSVDVSGIQAEVVQDLR